MVYERSQMLFNGGHYSWDAQPDKDNSFYKYRADGTLLKRTEGFEVLFFINYIAGSWPLVHSLQTYNRIERMIRYSVPTEIQSHLQVAAWIILHWSKC